MHRPVVLDINTDCILLITHLFAPIPLGSVVVQQTEVLLISAASVNLHFSCDILYKTKKTRSVKMPKPGV